MAKLKFLLASQSPRRFELLNYWLEAQQVQAQIQVRPTHTPETVHPNDSPLKTAKNLAYAKFLACTENPVAHTLYLTADTVVEFNRQLFGKPKSLDQAKSFLKIFSGQTHSVHTALYLGMQKKTLNFWYGMATTKLAFHKLSTKQINHYLSAYEVLDKAGGYGLQDLPPFFVREITGSRSNVVGLPLDLLSRLWNRLLQAGVL